MPLELVLDTHPTVCLGLMQKWNPSVAGSLSTAGLHNCLLCMAEYDRPTFLMHCSQWRVVARSWRLSISQGFGHNLGELDWDMKAAHRYSDLGMQVLSIDC